MSIGSLDIFFLSLSLPSENSSADYFHLTLFIYKENRRQMETKNQKKTHGMPERQRLLCRWAMELAALLQEEHDMDKKTALELAHLTRELIMRLGSGKVWFVYRKEDGTERHAEGTLCPGISTEFDSYELKGSRKKADQWPTEVFTYWDLEKQAFRTFKASKLIKIKAATIVNSIHSSRLLVNG